MSDITSYSYGMATLEIILLWLLAFGTGFFLCKCLRFVGLIKQKQPVTLSTEPPPPTALSGTFTQIPEPPPPVKTEPTVMPDTAPGVNTAALLNVNLNRAIQSNGNVGIGYEADLHSLIHARKTADQSEATGVEPETPPSPAAPPLNKAASATPIDTSKRSTRLERTTVVPTPAKASPPSAHTSRLTATDTTTSPPSEEIAGMSGEDTNSSTAGSGSFENRLREMTLPVTETAKPTRTNLPDNADNLQKLQGVDSEVAALLHQAGIHNYKQLASTSLRDLENLLQAGGSAFNTYDPKSWPYQAELAAKNNWDRLKDYQEFLSRSD